MLNLIRMDMHRLVRTVSFWVMIVVAAAISLFSVFMTEYEMDMIREGTQVPTVETEADVNINVGVYVDTDSAWAYDDIDFTDVINVNLAGQLMLILCAIFPPLFVNADHKHGYIKNIAGQLPHRGVFVVSKLVAVGFEVIVMMAVFLAASYVSGLAFWGERLVVGSAAELAKLLGVHLLLHFSFASVMTALTVLLRNGGFSMTIGILSATGIGQLLYNLANVILHKLGVSEDFAVNNYFVDACIAQVSSELQSGELFRIVTVGAVFLLLSAAVSVIVMQKRDI